MRKFLLIAAGALLPVLSASAALQDGDEFWTQGAIQYGYKVTSATARTVQLRNVNPENHNVKSALVIPSTATDEDGTTYTVTSIGLDGINGWNDICDDYWSSITIPASVEEIMPRAFIDASSCTSVIFNEGLKKIGDNAFNWMNISSVSLPQSLEYMGDEVFNHTNVTSLSFGANLKHLGTLNPQWTDENYITTLTLPEGIESVGNLRYVETINFNITDLEAWCANEIEGYNPYLIFQLNTNTGEYDIQSPATVNMTYKGNAISELTLPMGVTSIKPYAFACVDGLRKVTLPAGVKTIGAGAFANTAIDGISLPESVETIGDYAFAACENIDELILPAGLKALGAHAFENCTAIPEVIIPTGIEKIGDYAFSGCADMSDVNLNEGLKEIGAYAFNACEHIKAVTLPSTLETIGDYAFYQTAISELTCPDALTTIGDFAFARTNGTDENNYSYLDYYEELQWYIDASKFPTGSKVTFNEGLESIGVGAFCCWDAQQLSLPSTLKSVGKLAFAYSKITDLKLPDAMTEIGEGAFGCCTKLRNVTLGNAVTNIAANAFRNTDLYAIDLPATLTAVGENAFTCTKLINVSLPDAVTAVGTGAFATPRYIKIGTGLTSIPTKMAESCDVMEMASATPPTLTTERLGFTPNLVLVPQGAAAAYTKATRWKDYNIAAVNGNPATVYVENAGTLAEQIRMQTGLMPAVVTNLAVEGTLNDDDFAVMRSNLKSCYDLDLSRLTNTELPDNALSGNKMLLNVKLPTGLEKIGTNAFTGCSVMHLDEMPAGIKTIGDGAFEGCESMDNDFVMPETLDYVGYSSFFHCFSLKSIDMSAAKTDIFRNAAMAFNGCAALKSAVLPKTIETLPSNIFAESGLNEITIPWSVKTIGDSAFEKCGSLHEVTFQKGLTNIGVNAFAESGLRSAELPSSLEQMSEGAFANTQLAYINFNDKLTAIPNRALDGCADLIVINLPTALTEVGEASLNAAKLSAINSPSLKPAATAGNPFADVNTLTCALSIPKPSYTDYLKAEHWGSFVGIRNSIDVTMDPGTDATYMDEGDYQDMLDDMEQQGDENNPEEAPALNSRRRALRVLEAKGVTAVDRGYGKLFNGAQLIMDDKAVTRFFVHFTPDVTEWSITYNGKPVTLDQATSSFVVEGLDAKSQLVIKTNGTGVEQIEGSNNEAAQPADIYDLTGRKVRTAATSTEGLPAGIYIMGGKKLVVK